MDINDKKVEENWKRIVNVAKKEKTEIIIEARKRRKGFENFFDMLPYMTNDELKNLYKTKEKKFYSSNSTYKEKEKLFGELSIIRDELRRIPNRIVKTNKKEKWFEDLGFLISYGVDGKITPIGDTVTYKQLGLGSLDIQQYESLSDEYKKKHLEAVFSNKKGDLKLRIPVVSLMELRLILEDFVAQKLVDDAESSSLTGLSLDDIEATIESIDVNGKSTRTLLGTNYIIYPLQINKDKERIREREKDTSDELEI